MKSYEDMAKDIFRRRDEYVEKKKKTRRMIFGSVTPIVCCCLVAVMGVGILQRADSPTPSFRTEESMTTEDTSEEGEETDIKDNKDILWADTKTLYINDEFGSANSNYLRFHGELKEKFYELDENQPIAVCIAYRMSHKKYAEMGFRAARDNRISILGSELEEKYDSLRGGMNYLYAAVVDELLDQGLSFTEIAKSEKIIDRFNELYEGEYGLKDFLRIASNAIEPEILYAREHFESLGLDVIYDGIDDDWGAFFEELAVGYQCVVVTTPKRLIELSEIAEEISKKSVYDGYGYHIMLAPEKPDVALKHYWFNWVLRDVPAGKWLKNGSYVEGYNGNVDEFYEMVLEERKKHNN